MTDKPLVPPKTPMCQEYLGLRLMWIQKAYKSESWIEAYNKMSEHRASCELCKARIEEFNELARNALEPEVSDV